MLTLFFILLVLLTIISAIGGSIKTTENFWEDNTPPIQNLSMPPPVIKNDISSLDKPKLEKQKLIPQIENIPQTENISPVQIMPSSNNKLSLEQNKIEPFQGSMLASWQ